jgi:hypothetical protein
MVKRRMRDVRNASGMEGLLVQFMVMRLPLTCLGHTGCVDW